MAEKAEKELKIRGLTQIHFSMRFHRSTAEVTIEY